MFFVCAGLHYLKDLPVFDSTPCAEMPWAYCGYHGAFSAVRGARRAARGAR